MVAYHRTIGIEKFFLADNCSEDGSTELLAALGAAVSFAIFHFPPFQVHLLSCRPTPRLCTAMAAMLTG